MQELYGLLEYINYYQYSKEDEEIKIIPSPYEEEAKKQYETALRAIGSRLRRRTEEDDELFLFGGDSRKWHLDVAIDCVRQMDENDRTYVANHLHTTDYHFGYAMGIRNEYIYPAKKHHSFMADNDSTEIMKVIFSILHRGYSFRNPVCTKYFESFEYGCLVHKYGESAKDLFVAIENRIFSQEENLTAEDALNQLKESLTKKYGKISIY